MAVGSSGRSRLSGALARLVADPRGLSALRLWQALDAEERRAATAACLATHADSRVQLNRVVAEARNFRPDTVRKWPEEKICGAMRFMSLRDSALASRLLQCHHVPGQRTMVAGFLDDLGVAHTEGLVESLAAVDADEDVIRSAVGKLVTEYGARATAVYMLTLRVFDAPAGATGRACLKALVEAGPGAEASEAGADTPGTTESLAEDSRTEQEDPTRQPSFTTLDRLLIRAAVDSAQGIAGALTEDELDDLVDELVTLNSSRHQSYFHAGYRDVLFDKPLAEELPAENQSRLRWYWTGAVQGLARREHWNRIVGVHTTNPVVRGLGSGSNRASVAAVSHIVEALRREGHTAEIARFVKVRALVGQPSLFRLLLEASTELLRKGDAARALPILELLMEARRELEEMGVPSTTRLLLDAQRRMAHCLRHLHQHERARRMLSDLLNDDPNANVRAMLHADLGLIVGGFDGLDEVVLPVRGDELEGVLDRLAGGVEHFRESVEFETAYSAHGHYCLGVLALGRAVADHAFNDAEHHLQAARTHFSEAADSYPAHLVENASLYFGIAKAQELSSDKLAHAADVITGALEAGARIPGYLIEATVLALGLAEEPSSLRRVTEAIIETGGGEALDELANCDAALYHCPALADRLSARAGQDVRAAVERAEDLRAALRGFLRRGDWTAAGEALDGLERLARIDAGVPEFLQLLEDRDRYDPVWDLQDATIARARCYEDRGEFSRSARVLRDLFYRFASPERAGGLNDATGVLERIRGYGIDTSHYSDMTNRYNALAVRETEEDIPVAPHPAQPVRVLVVGGGEMQAMAAEVVRRKLEGSHPHVRARFIRTGWSSNWQRRLREIEREMEQHDALVIIRFMRTHLGREIRRRWRGPWRSCWGGGAGAITEAVSRAAAAVH